MPEIAEVARTVHYLRTHLLNKILKQVIAAPDDIVYGKVGTSADQIEKSLTGRKVIDVGQQGKYFWFVMDKPPHPVMHFGMSGWFRIKGVESFYYRGKEGSEEVWPPKFWKFHITAEKEGKGKSDVVQAAFVDMRRLARVRLVDCDGQEIRRTTPLKENGPDPVIDKDIVTVGWLKELCNRKKVPIKAMLLDQANISGIGNWVGDEVMYHSKIHPEQYANTLQDSQITQLHNSIHYVCGTACELLADSEKFPEDWLFKHRWGKGKKGSTNTLPNGNKIVFLTVGGRTSAVVPAVQKKTGPVAKDVEEDKSDDDDDVQDKKAKKQAPKSKAKNEVETATRGKKRKAEVKEDDDDDDEDVKKELAQEVVKPTKAKANEIKKDAKGEPSKDAKATKQSKKAKVDVMKEEPLDTGKRRSGRPKK